MIRDASSTPTVPGGLPFDATQIQFTALGTGAVARTVQEKERDVVSVFDFMTTAQIADVQANTLLVDVTAPINTAIGTGARRVLAPVGSYLYTGALNASASDVIIEGCGYGTRFVQQTGTPAALNITASRVRVWHCRFSCLDASGAATSNAGAIFVGNVDDVEILGNIIDSGRLQGIMVVAGKRHRILFNDISGINANSAESDSTGIRIRTDTATISDALIFGNVCRSAKQNSGILMQTLTASQEINRCRVIGNYINLGAQTGGGVTGHGIVLYSAVTGTKMRSNVFANNIVDTVPGTGIYVQGNGSSQDALNTVITGNQLINTVQTGSALTLVDAAIGVDGAPRTTIKGNEIVGGGYGNGYGIRVHTGSDDCDVEGNQLSSLGSMGSGGIAISTSANHPNRVRIRSNYVQGVNAPHYRILNGTFHRLENNTSDTGLNAGYVIDTNDVTLLANHSNADAADAFRIGANANRTQLLHNTITALGGGAAIADSGVATRRFGNRISTGAWQGQAVLVAGTVTVNTAEVQATENIVLNRVLAGGALGHLSIGAITIGTSFVINSSSATDTSTIFWEIHH